MAYDALALPLIPPMPLFPCASAMEMVPMMIAPPIEIVRFNAASVRNRSAREPEPKAAR
jgi:hypothetical protein